LKTDYALTPTKPEDALLLAPNMRRADQEEIWASSMAKPLASLAAAIRASSISRTGWADGSIVCIFGIAPRTMISDHGIVWMLGSNLLPDHSFRFLRECKEGLVDISAGFSIIENWCDARNTVTLRWLRWLGFTIEDAQPYGVYRLPFHHFYSKVV
jgi:hypothetical protein